MREETDGKTCKEILIYRNLTHLDEHVIELEALEEHPHECREKEEAQADRDEATEELQKKSSKYNEIQRINRIKYPLIGPPNASQKEGLGERQHKTEILVDEHTFAATAREDLQKYLQ